MYLRDFVMRLCKFFISRVFIAFLIGILFGYALLYFVQHRAAKETGPNFYSEVEIDPRFERIERQVSVQETDSEDFEDFWEVWRLIEAKFVPNPHEYEEEEDEGLPEEDRTRIPTKEEFLKGAIDGLTWATKDVYTNFFNPREADDFTDEIIEGEIDGIGAYIGIRNNRLTVIRPLSDSPAKKAGLRADDVITKIDGVSTKNYNLLSATEKIRGPRGSEVVLTVFRNSDIDELEIPITRARVVVPSIETEVRDNVFIISLLNFSQHTVPDFKKALQEFADEANSGGADRILLDMRGNSGGILSTATHVAGFFLPEDAVVLYEYTGSERLRSYRTKGSVFKSELPKMTVLLDGGSASASEILAAALRHHGVADIVGLTSFGKGSVQSLVTLSDTESILKITIAHWLTPDKRSLTDVGIEPDVDYEEDVRAKLKEDSDFETDEYLLERAVQHLSEK